MIEKPGECFCQDMKTMAKRYYGRWDTNVIIGNCWCVKRNVVGDSYEKKQKEESLVVEPLIFFFLCGLDFASIYCF